MRMAQRAPSLSSLSHFCLHVACFAHCESFFNQEDPWLGNGGMKGDSLPLEPEQKATQKKATQSVAGLNQQMGLVTTPMGADQIWVPSVRHTHRNHNSKDRNWIRWRPYCR